MAHGLCRPRGGLIRVTRRTWIGDFVFVRHRWSNERKGVRAHEDARNCNFDFWHVAGNAIAARRAVFVVRMGGKR